MSTQQLSKVIHAEPYLPTKDKIGFVTLNEQLVYVKWAPTKRISMWPSQKQLCERVAAEAAIIKGFTEVTIR